jgi:hypothetical protein
MPRRFAAMVIVALVLGTGSVAQSASIVALPTQLSNLVLDDNTTQVGDKVFSSFTFSSSSALTSSQVTVSGLPLPGSSGPWGLSFSGPFVAGSGTSTDALLSYVVTSLADPITRVDLIGNPMAVGLGAFSAVTETIFDPASPLTPLGQIAIYAIGGGSSVLSSSFDLATPLQSLLVRKDIINTGGLTGSAGLSFVDQTFTQGSVPAPASLSMLGLGMLAVSAFSRYRRRHPA